MGIFKLNKNSIGYKGEKIAERFLKKKGYKILQRNWCNKKGKRIGEIDIIAPDVEYAKELGGLDTKHLREMRFCSKEQFPMYVDITLYGGRFVGIMSFKDGLGLIIESEGIYKTLKSIFEMNWLMLEK